VKAKLNIFICISVFVGLGVYAVFMTGIPQSLARQWRVNKLVRTIDRQAVLTSSIPLILACTNDKRFIGDDLTNLPPIIAGMRPKRVSISHRYMVMEYHGGFNHFGFAIVNEEQSWRLTTYTEQGQQVLFEMSKEEH
jgi:hypothetical protein